MKRLPASSSVSRSLSVCPAAWRSARQSSLEARLNALGLFRYEQIGRWGDDEIEAFQAQLPEFPGRIRREAWVKSARDEYLRKYRHPLG